MRGAGEGEGGWPGWVGAGAGAGSSGVFFWGGLFWLLCFDDGGVERAREGEEMTRASQEINHTVALFLANSFSLARFVHFCYFFLYLCWQNSTYIVDDDRNVFCVHSSMGKNNLL
jgi:hypothetical protein